MKLDKNLCLSWLQSLLISWLTVACILQDQYSFADGVLVEASPCSSVQSSASSLNRILVNLTGESNISLQLEPGEHCIREFSVVRDIADLRIVGNGAAYIKCTLGMGLAFYNMSGLTLSGFEMDNCGMNLEHFMMFSAQAKMDIDFFFQFSNQSNQYIAIVVGNTYNFRLVSCQISNTRGLAFMGINLMGEPLLSKVVFKSNGLFLCLDTNNDTILNLGGGAMLLYHDYLDGLIRSNPVTQVIDCVFSNNYYCGYSSALARYNAFFTLSQDTPQLLAGGGGGLSVALTQLLFRVNVAVYNTTFRNNTSILGNGAFVAIFTGVSSQVSFIHCEFESNGIPFTTYQESLRFPTFGGAIQILLDSIQPRFAANKVMANSTFATVRVIDCWFQGNYAFAGTVAILSLFNYAVPLQNRSRIELIGCVFQDNQAINGPAVYALDQKFNPYKSGTILALINVTAVGNRLITEQRIQSPIDSSAIIHLTNFMAFFAGNNSLMHSEGSSLKSDSSLVQFQDNTTFFNNSASYGGAIQMVNYGYIVLAENARVYFLKNVAAVAGGAVYVNVRNLIPDPLNFCFLLFEVNVECLQSENTICGDVTTFNNRLTFEGNEALLGSMIYGATFEECLWAQEFRQKHVYTLKDISLLEIFYAVQQNVNGKYNFTTPFEFDRPPDNVVEVATPVTSLKASLPDSGLAYELKVAPGIQTKIELASYDGFNRLVPTSVSSRSYQPNTRSVIGRNYTFINYNSTEVSPFYLTTTMSNATGTNATVTLFTDEPFSVEWNINVVFEECPDGFYYNGDNSNCTCYENLASNNVFCTSDGQLLVPVNMWVGLDDQRILNIVVCPFDYCKRTVSIFDRNLSTIDSRCNPSYNRSGLGCGSCSEGFSLTLGSNSCAECSNAYLFMLIVFLLWGIALVAILMQLNFTISGGFLNGLLFFSNILSLYGPIYARNFNSVFVLFSWLSLKVGFQTCFFNGLTALQAATLRFVFPTYLYFILLLIYILAEKSSRFSLWLSKRCCTPTHLFVTILIMTYYSFLESCVHVLSATTVTVFNADNMPENQVRWQVDPSQDYFRGYHAALAVFSIVVLIFFLIPLPFVCLLNLSLKHIRFLSHFIPFLDAVWAPLKPQFRFWVSFRLLLRIFPLFFFYLTPPPYNLFALQLFLWIVSFVQGMLQPYKNVAQNCFDSFLLLILSLMNFISLFYFLFLNLLGVSEDLADIESTNTQLTGYEHSQKMAIIVLVIFAYLSCTVMFIWHLWTAFPSLKHKLTNLVRQKPKQVESFERSVGTTSVTVVENENLDDIGDRNTDVVTRRPMYRPPTFSELRESLLDDPSVQS